MMGSTSAHDRRRARPSQRISSHPRLWLCLDYGSVLAMACLVASAAGFPASSTVDAAQATLRRTAVLGFVETDGCKAWCADHTASLRVKCTYVPCTTCEECTGVDMSAPIPIDERDPLALNTTVLHAPSPTEAIKPTSASPPAVAFTLPAIETIVPTVGGCKSWCAAHTAALEVKCTYTTCSACAECEPINGKMINTDEPTVAGPTSPATSDFGSTTKDDAASSPCVDDASFPCVAWAKSGECQRIPVFMHSTCALSCGCNGQAAAPGSTLPKPTTPITARAPATSAAPAVPAENDNCKSWCGEHTASLEVKCTTFVPCNACAECKTLKAPATIDVPTEFTAPALADVTEPQHSPAPTAVSSPTTACTDAKDMPCAAWAQKGECQRIPVFMHATCALSCGCPAPASSAELLRRDPAMLEALVPSRRRLSRLWKQTGALNTALVP